MSQTSLTCENEGRRRLVRQASLNGLDYLEVSAERELTVYFLGKAPQGLQKENVRIRGGRRIRDIVVEDIRIVRDEAPDLDDYMLITVDKQGDFSAYTLCVVDLDEKKRPLDRPFPGFDPRYNCLDFSFRVDCPTDLDCKEVQACPPPLRDEPEINYLAKDYASFRQLILDRLALLMPDWQEEHIPDLGITLVEILAYVGDYLSYYQDAVATEAYLDTARQRISVRRHARLVDYPMHEGSNARAFVHVHTGADSPLPGDKIAFVTGLGDTILPADRVLTWGDLQEVPRGDYEVFEPLQSEPGAEIRLYAAHNEIHFYTWGDTDCCLSRGATSATLVDGPPLLDEDDSKDDPQQAPYRQYSDKSESEERGNDEAAQSRVLRLQAGDILIFEEVLGPKTGFAADADPTHRHAVRLTAVIEDIDPLTRQPVLEVTWEKADALPFPVCISAIGPPPGCEQLENISVARGNVILVDHGRRVSEPEATPWCVPTAETEITCEGVEQPSEISRLPGRFRPRLKNRPLTFAEPYPADRAASRMLQQDPRRALPWIRLTSRPEPACEAPPDIAEPDDGAGQEEKKEKSDAQQAPMAQRHAAPTVVAEMEPETAQWEVRRDLLSSGPLDYHFVAELDDEGRAHLRFGDGELGRQPEAGTSFEALYRAGVGIQGNVGAETIRHVVATETISGVDWQPRNPLPALGGVDPEPLAAVKRFAPFAFRYQMQRAITAQDYAAIVMRDFGDEVQRAAATLRWVGSWYEVLVAVDPAGSVEPEAGLLERIDAHLQRYRRVGHDLVVRPAQYVALDVGLHVCVRPAYLRGHVKAALLQRFGSQALPAGGAGFFHPDNLTFGQGVTLSSLVAAAQAVTGVESVSVQRLQRMYEGASGEIGRGVLTLGPLEIARLDNDPSIPENGRLELIMEGGR